MLKIVKVKGDVLRPDQYLLPEDMCSVVHVIHGCNDQGVMGSGLALQIKNKFPEAFDIYKAQHNREEGNTIGLWSMTQPLFVHAPLVKLKAPKLKIVNAVTQVSFGNNKRVRYTKYDAVAQIFDSLKNQFRENNVVVAIPKLFASDRGNACWKVVFNIIKDSFKYSNITLYVVEWDR